jgi:hypothetical protein
MSKSALLCLEAQHQVDPVSGEPDARNRARPVREGARDAKSLQLEWA